MQKKSLTQVPPDLKKKNHLKQHFMGWYVKFNNFHKMEKPILMDIDFGQKNLCFTYVLPIDKVPY